MKLTVPVVLFILLILSFSCSGGKKNPGNNAKSSIVEVDLLSLPELKLTGLSQVASDVKYIPLSTNEESMIGFIGKVILNKGRYFLAVNTTEIMCFNKSGNFLFKLSKQGNGPDEYQFIIDFDISTDGQTLAVLSGNKIHCYSVSESGFIKKNSIVLQQHAAFISFVPGTENLLVSSMSPLGNEKALNVLINLKGDTLNLKSNSYRYIKSASYNIYPNNDVIQYKSGDLVCFKEVWSDTVFSVSREPANWVPYLIFNSNGTNVSTMIRSDQDYLNKIKNDFSQIASISEVDRYILYMCYIMGESHLIMYDKTDHVKYEIDRKSMPVDDITGGPDFKFLSLNNASEGSWYSSISTIALKKYFQNNETDKAEVTDNLKYGKLKIIADSLSDTDNPVLIIVTPKK